MVTCMTFRVEISLKVLYNFFKLILLFTNYVVPIVVYRKILLEGSLKFQECILQTRKVWLHVCVTVSGQRFSMS